MYDDDNLILVVSDVDELGLKPRSDGEICIVHARIGWEKCQPYVPTRYSDTSSPGTTFATEPTSVL